MVSWNKKTLQKKETQFKKWLVTRQFQHAVWRATRAIQRLSEALEKLKSG